jgi:hypothetical protein
MKKLLTLLTILSLTVYVTGCGDDAGQPIDGGLPPAGNGTDLGDDMMDDHDDHEHDAAVTEELPPI